MVNLFRRLLYGNRHAARCWADLNSLINSILLIDDNLAIHYATPPRNNCSPKAPANCLVHRYGTVELLLIKYRADARKSGGGQGFTDNEVTLVIDGRSHILL